ncbi:MAG: hypothetical protein ABI821_08405 [Pseudomonadota bacterium]
MLKGIQKFAGVAAVLACGLSSQAFAQTQTCVPVLKSVAEVEKEVVDAKGVKSTKLMPLATATPGTLVIYTTTASNGCKQPIDNIEISNFVPEHMTYVASSAMATGAEVTYSLDGKTFGTADQLTVLENGVSRKARADEYKFFRWAFKGSLAPGAQAAASFRAVLN